MEGDAEGAIQRVGLYRKAEKDRGTFSITQTKALGKHFKMESGTKSLLGGNYLGERGCRREYLVEFFGRIYSTGSCKIYFWNLELESWM